MNAQRRIRFKGLPHPGNSVESDRQVELVILPQSPAPELHDGVPESPSIADAKPLAPAGRSTMQGASDRWASGFSNKSFGLRVPKPFAKAPRRFRPPEPEQFFWFMILRQAADLEQHTPCEGHRATWAVLRRSATRSRSSSQGHSRRPGEWFVHVREQGGRFVTRPVGPVDQASGKNLRLFRISKEGSVAKLDAEHQSLEAGSEFFGKNGSGIKSTLSTVPATPRIA